MRYLITLYFADHSGAPAQRYIDRDSIAEAVDAAVRMLRFSRNVAPVAARRYDRWSVAASENGRLPCILAAGDLSTL